MNLAEFLSSDGGPANEGASVLIQTIMSIKSIIKRHPASHEKVFSSCHTSLKLLYAFSDSSSLLL